MKKATGRISLAIGILLAVALLAACGGGNGGASDAFTLEDVYKRQVLPRAERQKVPPALRRAVGTAFYKAPPGTGRFTWDKKVWIFPYRDAMI